nr:pesticin C-terminus-like muramidase [Pantoea cypripedii]
MLEPEEGLLTFRAEGNIVKSSRDYSRKIHWPGISSSCRGNSSGVTIGRGFDLGDRTKINVLIVLKKSGVNKEQAELISDGAGLKGCAAHEFVIRNRDKIGEISESQQLSLFKIIYEWLKKDVERICKNRVTIMKHHPDPEVQADEAWRVIPLKIKDVLIDLRYRGDYTPHSRELIQRFAYLGDMEGFGKVISNRALWPDVSTDRFIRRVDYYEKN